jgi:hypothetical protein
MSYLADTPFFDLFSDGSWAEINRRWELYRTFLAQSDGVVEENALSYARADWHYDVTDPRCMQSAKLVSINTAPSALNSDAIVELNFSGRGGEGLIQLKYTQVSRFNCELDFRSKVGGAFDLVVDEIGVSASGATTHTLVFVSGAKCVVEFRAFTFNFSADPTESKRSASI